MGKDSSEIRREIEETRARMGDTVEALGYKADVPSRVKDAVNDRVETVKGTISDVVDNVKDTVSGAGERVGNALGGARRSVSDNVSRTSDRVGDAAGGVTSNVNSMTAKVGDAATGVTNSVSNMTAKVGDAASAVTEKLPSPSDVTRVARRGAGMARENPLGLALGALAVGFLAGLVVPVTDYERDTVGPIRDDLVDRATHVGSDVIEHGKQVLQETAQAALSGAQQSAQQHGQQVLSEAKGEMQHDSGSNGSGGANEIALDRSGMTGDTSPAQGTRGRSGMPGDVGDTAMSAGMPSDAAQGGGLRAGTDLEGGTGAQTPQDAGTTSSQYAGLGEGRNTLEPGSPGTASP